MIRAKQWMAHAAEKTLQRGECLITHAKRVMGQHDGEQAQSCDGHKGPVLAGNKRQAAGVLTPLREEGSQLRDSAGFAPDFPRYLPRLTP